MNDLLIYLLKVSLGLTIVAVPYYTLLRNDPNLLLKRLYLILGLAASWGIPLLVFKRPDIMVHLTPTVFIDPLEGEVLPMGEVLSSNLGKGGAETELTINWFRILLWIYLTGLAFLMLKNLVIITKWNLQWRKRQENGVAFTPSDQVFTLFTRIFIPESLREEEDLENVILHERAHIKQLHFIDLMLMELTLLLTWFNPFSWLISRMIKENHEHLADRQVLSAGVSAARYRAQLMNHTLGVNVFRLGMQFNHSLTLNRFKMMKKPKRSLSGIAKLTFLMPVLLIAMALTTGMSPPQQETIKGKVVLADCGDPAVGAAVVIANSTRGTVVDREGSFELRVEGDRDLVISFVGYATLHIKASKIGKKALKLEPATYEIDLEKVPVMIKQTENGSISMYTEVDNPDKPPVFVVDGKVVEEINHIDPKDIESISVIKNPDSEEAIKYNASHVILISTKKKAKTKKKEEVDVLKHDEEVFYVVEEMPGFRGGKADLKTYIYSNLEYPTGMKEKGISGEVRVGFLVNAKGELENIEVLQSSGKDFEEPALEVFRSMPAWKPGKQRGKPVKVRVMVPVRFDAEKD